MDSNHYNAMITKSKLLIALLENKASREKIKDIKKCLDEGVNVNVQFSDFSNNTPLHIAATIADKDVVAFLLENDAKLDIINDDGKIPMDIAKELNTEKGREIVVALETTDKNPQAIAIAGKNSTIISRIQHAETQRKYTYTKRSGTSGISGHLYESKLLSLTLIRLLTNEQRGTFYLANNIDGIGALDDICLRYKKSDEDVMMFVQAKHKTDTNKGKISKPDLWREGSDFNLPKYFDSYLQIRQKFDINNKDVMFTGLYEELKCVFILYTTVKDDLNDKKYVDDEKFRETEHVRNLVNTDKNANMFQYKYEDIDIDLLTQTLLKQRLKVMGKKLLEFIYNNKYQMMINDQDIKSFHVVLAQKVIDVSEIIPEGYRWGTFREEFFSNHDILLTSLRETLYSEAVRKTKLKSKEIQDMKRSIFLDPSPETISKLIGTAVKYDTKNNILELVENKSKEDVAFGELLSKLSQVQVREAFEMAGMGKLKSLKFKLPTPFGNFDMTINKSKAEKRLDFLVGKIKNVIDLCDEKCITIDESIVGPNKILESGIMDVNGGIGGAMGNVLILDDGDKLLKVNMNEATLSAIAKRFLEKLLDNIPNIDTYRFKINIVDFPRLSLDANEFERSFSKDFLNNLWFYTCQAKQHEIENIANQDIEDYCNAKKQSQSLFHIKPDAIFSKIHYEVQKWWSMEGEIDYLTNNTQNLDSILYDFVKSPMLNALSFFYVNKIKAYGIEFSDDAVQSLSLDTIVPGLTILITDLNVLSGVKLVQFFKDYNTHKFIDLDYVLSLNENNFNKIILEIRSKKVDAFIVLYENISKMNNLSRVKCVIDATIMDKVIFVTQKEIASQIENCLSELACVEYKDEMNSFPDLNNVSQRKVLESDLIFQGEKLKFGAIIDEETKHFINADILLRIVNKEIIAIGKPLTTSNYDIIKDNYVTRSLNKNNVSSTDDDFSNDSFDINTLEGLSGTVIILAPPRTGKSLFLTHLSIQTKKNNCRNWIETFDFEKNWHPLCLNENNEVDINDIVTFLCKSALSKHTNVEQEKFFALWKKQAAFLNSLYTKEEFKITDVEFDVDITNGLLTLKSYNNMSDLMLLELKLFIHWYNKGNVIFLFDNVDEILLCYEEIVPYILNFIASKPGQRIWMTSNCYNKYTTEIMDSVSCTPYALAPVQESKQYAFFEKYLQLNLNLEGLGSEQLENLDRFFEYMRRFLDSLGPVKIMSCVVHRLYVTAIEYIQDVMMNNHAIDFRANWIINVDKFKSFDMFVFEKRFASPQEMHLAADYFKRRILDNEFEDEEWDIDGDSIDFIFKMCNLEGTPYVPT